MVIKYLNLQVGNIVYKNFHDIYLFFPFKSYLILYKEKGPLIGAGFPISCVGVISVVINSPNYSVYGKQT